MILYPHQQAVKNEIYSSIRNGKKRVVVQAATSFGKTALASSIVLDALKKDVGTIFTAPMITLVDQTAQEFYKFGIKDIGIIQADHPLTDFSQPVQVCSIQSIASLMKKDPEGWQRFQAGKLIIHDECHMRFKTHIEMELIADKPTIGLSATPWAKGMADHYDDLILGPSVSWLIENGHLSKYKAFSHYQPDMKGVAVNASGDYSLSESGDKYEPKIIGNIINTWKSHAEGEKTILFAPRVADAERFAAEFRAAGVSSVAVSGYMDNEDCAIEVELFREGKTTVICSVAKLAIGFSVTDVGCIIDAQPTKSLMRHIQKIGRGLRTHTGKDHVIILDNAGNLLRNGLPDSDDFPMELSDGKDNSTDRKKKDAKLPTFCGSCGAEKETHKCPKCGFAPVAESNIEVEEGELVELSAKTANRKTSWPDKVEFIGQLKTYAIDHGYRPGWVAHQYKEKFGVWPNDPRVKAAPGVAIGDEVIGWITHQAIKRAHSK